MRLRSTILFVCCALLLPGAETVAAKKKGGDDRLVVRAEFEPAPESEWSSWRILIRDDGIIELEFPEAAPRRPPRLDGRQIQALLTTVEAARFEQLQPTYSLVDSAESDPKRIPGDADRLSLDVRTGDGMRNVTLDTPEYAVGLQEALEEHPRRPEIARFLKLWNKVINRFRPPNREQTPGIYKP